MDIATIQDVVRAYAPTIDTAVLEYLVQLLSDHDGGTAAAYDDDDTTAALITTVAQFLDDDVAAATQIVKALAVLGVSENRNAPNNKNEANNTNPSPQQKQSSILLSQQQVVETTQHPEETETAAPKVNRVTERKERRKQKQQQLTQHDGSLGQQQSTEDDSSAWIECLEHEQVWGGRGKGGRGAYAGRVNSVHSNVHLTDVTVSLPNGTELLSGTTIDICRGHRYGLIGRNGVGKSTLLRRLAARAIPGMPHTMRVLLVEQQQLIPILAQDNVDDSEQQQQQQVSAAEALVQADVYRTALLQEQDEIEALLQQQQPEDSDSAAVRGLTQAVERLKTVASELDVIQADTAEARAVEILKGLSFTDTMIHGPAANLSGGWRMMLALARALFVPTHDLILLDECTNHLDLRGLDWLIHYINSNTDTTLMVVSHDRGFLDAVCTDIVVMEHQKLSYHVGNYSMYEQQQHEKATREAQILDAAERQRTKAMAFVQKQQASAKKKSADPNKQRQAKMIREKKMDRIGNYREDGKRYKQFSLKTLDEKSVRLAQKVQIEVDEPVIKMYFPDPTWPPSVAPNDTIVRMENLSFGYTNDKLILNDVTLSLGRSSKVALVGKNGCGKTSLVKLIAGEHTTSSGTSCIIKGDLWIHPNLRIGHVTQYTVEELEAYSEQTVVEYAEQQLKSGRASATIVAKASGNVRQYLGAFGLGGKHAMRQIGKLSGGERMRLCFATVLAENPGLLLLDESSNHVDIETLESMSAALNAFEGSVLMVSHNQAFLSGFCKELWVLEDGHVTVNHSDTESFDEMFSQYRRSQAMYGGTSLGDRRRQKASLAKRATTQRAGAQQNTALL